VKGFSVILRREVFGLFISPATYVAAFYFLTLLGLGFRFFLESFARTDWLLPPLASLVVALIFGSPALIPFLTMRSMAEERRLGTLETLLVAPISVTAVVAGKWFASYIYFILVCLSALGFPCLAVWLFHEETVNLRLLEPAQLIGGGIYLLAAGSAFTAIGIFASSVTRNQMVAGMLSFTLLTLHLALMAYFHGEMPTDTMGLAAANTLRDSLGSLTTGLDRLVHFVVGIIDIATLLNYLVTTCLFLGFTILATTRLND